MIQEQLNSANVKCQYVILILYYFPCSRYFSSGLFLSKCDFRAQWETNHLGLIIISPVSFLFFALQEIDLWMSLKSLKKCDFSGTTDALRRLDYKLRNDYGIFCFPQALTPPPPRSISRNFSITDLDRFQLLRNFQSFFKAVHSPLTT